MKYNHSDAYYSSRYDKYKIEMKKAGLTPMSENNFISTYKALVADPKTASKNPMKDIIYSAKFGTKYKTALAERKALADIGIKVKLGDLKSMTTTDFADTYATELAREYRKHKTAGLSGKDAALLISQQWFGSN